MIPYELIVCSASRPHLLEPTLRTLLQQVDQLPERILIHDDAVFADRREAVAVAVNRAMHESDRYLAGAAPQAEVWWDNPPVHHGPALARLLGQVRTEYVLYSQDDHEVVRPLPVREALDVLDAWFLHQIRFNKRDTMDVKGEGPGAFRKLEQMYTLLPPLHAEGLSPSEQYGQEVAVPLCVADHWYFQTGVWRVASIKPVVDWWMAHPEHGDFGEHMEMKVNRTFNGEYRAYHPQFPSAVPILRPEDGAWNDPAVRARVHRTFIWGRVGEPAFVRHLGTDPKDWALKRDNRDPITNI